MQDVSIELRERQHALTHKTDAVSVGIAPSLSYPH